LAHADVFIQDIEEFEKETSVIPRLKWIRTYDGQGRETDMQLKCSFAFLKIKNLEVSHMKRPLLPKLTKKKVGLHVYVLGVRQVPE
jgi:hypothetical protein